MLFQPTNITPDMLGGIGNGTVAPTDTFTVSWQVNGNSPMTAFRIDVYKNAATATSTSYTTGKKTITSGFYPINAIGERQTYTYTDTATFGTRLGATSGEFKIVITQFWKEGTTEKSIVQSSPSVFQLKAVPTVALDVPTISERQYTFEADYQQSNGDALNWVRWRLALNTSLANEGWNLLEDTSDFTISNWATWSRDSASVITANAGVLRINAPTATATYAKYKVNYLPYGSYKNKTYTLSFDVRRASGEKYEDADWGAYIGVNPADRINNTFGQTTDCYRSNIGNGFVPVSTWTRLSLTVDIPDGLTGGQADKATVLVDTSNLTVQFYVRGQDLEFRNIKLAEGNYQTAWTPSITETDLYDLQYTTIYDSGNIYGTSELKFYYDGFFTETNYVVRCDVETESGVQATSGWETFSVQYDTKEMEATATASKPCDGTSAINLKWGGFDYIKGESENAVYKFIGTDDNKDLVLTSGNITWQQTSNNRMDLPTPWNLLMRTTLDGFNDAVLSLQMDNNKNLIMSFDNKIGTLAFKQGSVNFANFTNVHINDTIGVVITPEKIYLRVEGLRGGLYPKAEPSAEEKEEGAVGLYPSSVLYPSADTMPYTGVYEIGMPETVDADNPWYEQGTITSISISAPQTVDYIQEITQTSLDERVIESVITNGDYIPQGYTGTHYILDFSDDINAGTVFFDGETIQGWSIYRTFGKNKTLKHIIDVPITTREIYDYTAISQQYNYAEDAMEQDENKKVPKYKYYVFPYSTSIFATQQIVSNEIAPCFWNWTILECELVDTNIYQVTNEFSFKNNLTSGSISNGNAPSILNNFTAFPTVQLAPQNYEGGTLTSLIGSVESKGKYKDSIALKQAILNLSTTTNTLFLKTRKGDIFEIKISGAISYETMDNTREQAINISIPWVQVGTIDGISIIGKL